MADAHHPFPGQNAATALDAERIVREALERHGGPSDRALLDVLWSYIHAPAGGRAALFLAVASRAVGEPYAPPASESVSPTKPAATGAASLSAEQLVRLGAGMVSEISSVLVPRGTARAGISEIAVRLGRVTGIGLTLTEEVEGWPFLADLIADGLSELTAATAQDIRAVSDEEIARRIAAAFRAARSEEG